MIIDGKNSHFTLAEGLLIDQFRHESEFEGIQLKLRLARLAFAAEHFTSDELRECGVHDAVRNNGVLAGTLRTFFDITMHRFSHKSDPREADHPLHAELSAPELGKTFKFALLEFSKAQIVLARDKTAETIAWVQEMRGMLDAHPELADMEEMKNLHELTDIDTSDAGKEEMEEAYKLEDIRALDDMATAGMIMQSIAAHFGLEPPAL